MGGGIRTLAAAVVICAYANNIDIANAAGLEPTLKDESGYTLKPSDVEESNVRAFTWDSENQKLKTQYYQIDIKRTPEGTGEHVQYYNWSKDDFGGDILVPTEDETSYAAHYDSTDHYARHESYNVSASKTEDLIEMDFIENHITSGAHNSNGIYNQGRITKIIGDFVHNYSDTDGTTSSNNGGAIYNAGTGYIGEIEGNFIGNFISASTDSSGGAILNKGSNTSNYTHIGNIKGNFISNYTRSTGEHNGYGGAIYNSNGVIDSITGDFIDNHAYAKRYADGGAIFNSSGITEIKNIKGDFVGNNARGYQGLGGAIFDIGGISNIEGNFIHNYTYSDGDLHDHDDDEDTPDVPVSSQGGAIVEYARNRSVTITGDFYGNYASSENHTGEGGAVYANATNYLTIAGDFYHNYILGKTGAKGGAIFNTETSNLLLLGMEFFRNYANTDSGDSLGGAIYNEGNIIRNSLIDSFFVQNYANTTEGDAKGGAIYNLAKTGFDLSFSHYYYNYTNNTLGKSFGGAVYNEGNLGYINCGSFTGNHADTTAGEAKGGAVYNEGDISAINYISFDENYTNNDSSDAKGGALYNKGNISEVNDGSFTKNYSISKSGDAKGGAVYNEGNIPTITNTSFVENHADSESGEAHGGAIWTNQDLNIISQLDTYEFSNNYVTSNGVKTQEAIYIDGDKTLTLTASDKGTLLFNDIINGSGYKLNLNGDDNSTIILNNKVINADAVLENTNLKLGAYSDIFSESKLTAKSGVINTADSLYTKYNFKELNSDENVKYSIDIALNADPEKDKADSFNILKSKDGIINLSNVVVDTVKNFKPENETVHIIQILDAADKNVELRLDGNIRTVKEAEAKMTSDDILAADFGLATTKSKNDSIKIAGWRDNLAAWAELKVDDDVEKEFTVNKGDVQKLTRSVKELSGKNIKITGESANTLDLNGNDLLSDISTEQNVTLSDLSLKNANKINNKGTLTLENMKFEDTFELSNNNTAVIKGKTDINGTVTSENKGTLLLDNAQTNITGKVQNQVIDNVNSNTTLSNIKDFQNNSLAMNGGSFNIGNLGLTNLHLNDLSLNNGDINIASVDVDLKNEVMGRLSADNYTSAKTLNGKINLNDMNITSDSKFMKTVIPFADEAIKNNVVSNIKEAPTSGQNWAAYSPIYKYDVAYSADGTYGNDGYFVFSRGNSPSGNPTDGFNPAVLPSEVASQAGGYATMNQTFGYAFEHADTFSALPSSEKFAMMNANKYSINEPAHLQSYTNEINSNGFFVKPYATFERIPLKNGPDVDTITYGTIIGADGDIKELKHGWATVSTGYIGYNGSTQHYSGVTTNQNGGLLGLTQTFYKNNFYTAITASVGASVADSSTMYGDEDFAMLLSGVASKTGYSFEFKDGKYIIQPSLLLSYTFVNTFDYTNAAGVRIKSDPLHSIQIRPNIKFAANTESGWQPYISAGVVYNVMDKTEAVAIDGITDDVRLPNMSVKPYAEYGIGIQKRWKDKYTGYAQAMARSGGRNGVALSFGFRMALGNDNNSVEKVDSKKPSKSGSFLSKLLNIFNKTNVTVNNNKPYVSNL